MPSTDPATPEPAGPAPDLSGTPPQQANPAPPAPGSQPAPQYPGAAAYPAPYPYPCLLYTSGLAPEVDAHDLARLLVGGGGADRLHQLFGRHPRTIMTSARARTGRPRAGPARPEGVTTWQAQR